MPYPTQLFWTLPLQIPFQNHQKATRSMTSWAICTSFPPICKPLTGETEWQILRCMWTANTCTPPKVFAFSVLRMRRVLRGISRWQQTAFILSGVDPPLWKRKVKSETTRSHLFAPCRIQITMRKRSAIFVWTLISRCCLTPYSAAPPPRTAYPFFKAAVENWFLHPTTPQSSTAPSPPVSHGLRPPKVCAAYRLGK